MTEKVRTVARARREFMPVLDPDFDDDDWRPLLGTPELHPDSWGAHDYAGVLSAECFPYHGTSTPYHQWRAARPKTKAEPRLWGAPWHAPELIEEPARFPQALAGPTQLAETLASNEELEPAREPEVKLNWQPKDGRLMPMLRADEDYEYLRQRYGKSFWAALRGYLNGRIEPWFRNDVERFKRCVIVDDD
jgi:hypothetical protein